MTSVHPTTLLLEQFAKQHEYWMVGHDRKPKSLRFLGTEIEPATFPEALEVSLFEEATQTSGRINYSSETDRSIAGRIRFRALLEKPEEP